MTGLYSRAPCVGVPTLDWNAYTAPHSGALGAPFLAGERVFAQARFRDPAAPRGTNLSSACGFVHGP